MNTLSFYLQDLTTCLHDAIISVPDSTIQGLNETQSTLRVLGVDLDSQLILRCKESHKDKHNIEFKQVDIMKAEGREQISLYMQNYSITNFDIVTSFSITMWIHLNHGDNGLKEYLKYLSDICGGFLVIEPQPWKCYRNAERRMKKDGCDSFDWYKKLTWRSDVTQEITDYLTNECKMQLEETFGLTEDWQRPVCLFRKTC